MQFIQYESINWCKFYLVKAPRKNARIFEVADSLALKDKLNRTEHIYMRFIFSHMDKFMFGVNFDVFMLLISVINFTFG